MNPEKLIEDLFDDVHLADYNLRSFTQDHLLRLSIPANNPGGIYSGLISVTTTKFNAFFGKMDNESIQDSINQSLTITTEETKALAITYLSTLEGLVSFKFGKTSGTYQQFYPHGLSEYHDANLDELPGKFTRFLTAANTHLLATNPTEVNEITTRITNYNNARIAQLTGFGTIETLQTGRRDDRTALTLQLTTNLLSIALNNLGNADNFNNYYNPAYLPLTEGGTSVTGLIAAGAVINAINQGVITQHTLLTLYNQGTDALVFSINDQAGVIHPTHQKSIAAGSSEKVDDLPVFAQYYLNIQNPSATDNGKWKIVIG